MPHALSPDVEAKRVAAISPGGGTPKALGQSPDLARPKEELLSMLTEFLVADKFPAEGQKVRG